MKQGQKQSQNQDSQSRSLYGEIWNSQKMDKIRYFGISEKQSATSLYHTTPVISFSKANRFNYKRHKELLSDQQQNIHLPSCLNEKTTSLSSRFQSTQDMRIKRKSQFPGPDNYNRHQSLEKKNQAKSFGVSYKSYKKVYQPENIQNILEENQPPGPGQYDIHRQIGSDKQKYSIQGRTFNSIRRKEKLPCPGTYDVINNMATQSSRFNKIGFGYGNKVLDINYNNNPGPGSYEIKSKFDQITKKPIFKIDVHKNRISEEFSKLDSKK